MDEHGLLAEILDLRDERAVDAALAGAKAANLARAASAGLPVRPGFVVTTSAIASGDALPAARAAWRAMGAPTVIVRSSSTAEDTETSSMAGQFTSVLGVADEAALAAALDRVAASAHAPHRGTGGRPMAVLVQAQVDAAAGGVLFGIEPLTGDRRSFAVDAARGSPEQVVSGRTIATHVVLSRRGRIRSRVGPRLDDVLSPAHVRELARLARRAAQVFGSPQDVEWAYDGDGRLWLLQSRAVTATGEAAHGPLYGPGPLAETFPDPLAPLEVELWIDPLREAIAAALDVVGIAPRRQLRSSSVVVVLGGRPAIDLELIGAAPRTHAWLRRLAPAAGVRRLLASWRTGRLRAALPLLAGDLLDAVDRELLALPPLGDLDDRALLGVLEAARTDLRALHGYEVLCGMLLPADTDLTAASLALRAVARGRRAGRSDATIVATDPVALALTAPRVGSEPRLPAVGVQPSRLQRVAQLGPREALRLRCRWVQELGARAAGELGRRLVLRHAVGDAADVRRLSLAELAAAIEGDRAPAAAAPEDAGPPLPTMFRLGSSGMPVSTASDAGDGVPASAGRVTGRVRHVAGPSIEGVKDVLVVDALVPELAAELDRVAAIVSETGSPLSHLAILARELAVPVAVGVVDARRRFPVGTDVLVDGGTGSVTVLDRVEER